MKGKNFIVRPGGKLVRESHRFGGHGHGHDRYSRLCRDQILMAELNRDFAGQLSQLGDTVEIEEPVSTWTVLEPMSGRFRSTIFVIEGEEELAIRIYAARHGGRHPLKVSCDCGCGPDYHLVEVQGSLRQATASVRRCPSGVTRDGEVVYSEGRAPAKFDSWSYHTLDQFLARPDVVVIREADMTTADFCEPTPRLTGPHLYSEDARALAWVLGAEL